MSFLIWLLRTLDVLLMVLEWFIFLWVILSWIFLIGQSTRFGWRHRRFFGRMEGFYYWLGNIVEPFVRPIRRVLSRYPSRMPGMMAIDFSPLVLILIIIVVRRLLQYAYTAILF